MLWRYARLILSKYQATTGQPKRQRTTRTFVQQLGLKQHFMPVQTSARNGVSAAVVDTLKRNTIPAAPLPVA